VDKMVTTKNSYDLHELLSALQKCIRRGLEYEATHFAVELEEFNPTALWNRLKVIASEDFGCANPNMAVVIESLHKSYLKATMRHDKKTGMMTPKLIKDEEYRLFLVNAVVCLCRSPKSRITDDLLNVVYLERQNERNKMPQIPDFALDMHTERGRKMGRGIDHFFNEGCKLENEAFPNPYKEKAKELLSKYGKPT